MLAKKVVKLSSSGAKLAEYADNLNSPMGIDVRYENP
jgi:hypothetical protein